MECDFAQLSFSMCLFKGYCFLCFDFILFFPSNNYSHEKQVQLSESHYKW